MISALEKFIRKARFLIVDDEVSNLLVLECSLLEEGHENVRTTSDARQALALYREYKPDIVLLDLSMPHMDGFAVLSQLRDITPPDENLPVIVLTADASDDTRNRALEAGARDFITKPFNPAELRLRVRNLLETRFLYMGLREQNRLLDERVSERTAELESALVKLRESQCQALRQERLHAFSEMAGGVVHDFNNVLMILMSMVEILNLGDEAERERSVETFRLVLQDAAQLVRRLHYFYRPRHPDDRHDPVDLRKVVEEAADLARPKWKNEAQAAGREIHLRLELERVPPTVCNASELREALLNLIFNAVDAMPGGGTLTLGTRPAEAGVEMYVSDTGMGMTDEVRGHCLDPFYSTKGECGTGLGLAMVYGIVERHGGKLEIESMPGNGTTFRISLPEKNAAAAPPAPRPTDASRKLRILLAEDDERLRQIIVRQLEIAGHAVSTAADGREALMQLELAPFDLLLTDLSMPRLNGISLSAAARMRREKMPIVMLTGFGAMMLPEGELPPGVDVLLSKPITGASLAAAIAQAAA